MRIFYFYVKLISMKSSEIRERFLKFFEERGHAILPSSSLIPENDSSVLFNTAGMQPLVPYLLGQKHPLGTRLANFQKCVRTVDLDDIGDNTHATFFEMMGNWSLGDYFKNEAINWSYELLTDKNVGFGLDPRRLYVTCFEGDENAERDNESAKIWQEIFDKNGITGNRVFFLPAKNNWWAAGEDGPCGPDTEMFYDLTGNLTNGLTHEEYLAADEKQEVVEIWNDVFMEFLKEKGKVVGKLANKNVDTGSGFERVAMVLQNKNNIYDTDIFEKIIGTIRFHSKQQNVRAERIIADHVRTAVMLIADGVKTSNTDQGYILRRLLRRAILQSDALEMSAGSLIKVAQSVIETYSNIYVKVSDLQKEIIAEIEKEETKFRKTLQDGLKHFKNTHYVLKAETGKYSLEGKDAFLLFSSYGFPIELTLELAKEKNISVDVEAFNEEFKKHQELSRAGADQKFKGGMGDASEQSIKYHTATHLLHQALHEVLGDHVSQKGSNITPERLRFDFTHTEKMTDEQKKHVEDIVNQKITEALPVNVVTLPKAEAEKTGARHFFGEKYPDEVTVYYIGDSIETAFSKEFCGGPHVKNTSELGLFKIKKEEAVSAGVRRIKATLE
jgi:alanyl-tRNA synthetase